MYFHLSMQAILVKLIVQQCCDFAIKAYDLAKKVLLKKFFFISLKNKVTEDPFSNKGLLNKYSKIFR